MATAEAYRQHQWWPREVNIRHGHDAQNIRIDTPDRASQKANGNPAGGWLPDKWNTGVPYQWGGFDTLAEFDAKVKRGLAAGDIYTAAKRAGLDAAVSQEAAGIDCSGFISRCWQLKRSFSTRELPSLCQPLARYEDLLPGDILNTHNAHVFLFSAWADPAHTSARVYEAGTYPTWKVCRREVTVNFLRQKGYRAFRYRGVRD